MQAVYNNISPKELEIYAEKTGLGVQSPIDLKIFLKEIKNKSKILEVGCGTGRLGMYLIEKFDYVGIDENKNYLDYFRSKLEKAQISFDKNQLQHISFMELPDDLFDVILFPWTVIADFTESNQVSALKRSLSLLEEGGLIILDNPAKGEVYNTAPGYNPSKFYYEDWEDKFIGLGFKSSDRSFYETKTGRNREIIVLK